MNDLHGSARLFFWLVGVEQWEGTVTFAQARVAVPRLGVLLEYSLRRASCVLSERPSRSSEMALPKRAFTKLPRPSVATSPKRESTA